MKNYLDVRKDSFGSRFQNLHNQIFGRLRVTYYCRKLKSGGYKWFCECECGEFTWVASGDLKKNKIKSCGCLAKEYRNSEKSLSNLKNNTIHAHSLDDVRTPTFESYHHMKGRCLNKRDKAYKNYGGRGVKICERWLSSFSNFLEDMGEKPKGYTLERINVNGHYEPSNCCWIPKSEQMKNTRRSVKNRNIAPIQPLLTQPL